LEATYRQLSSGEAVELPLKTSSFKRWAEELSEYAQSSKLEQELDYWISSDWANAKRLPADYPANMRENTVESAQTISVALNAADTQSLLQEVPKAYHTEINDVL